MPRIAASENSIKGAGERDIVSPLIAYFRAATFPRYFRSHGFQACIVQPPYPLQGYRLRCEFLFLPAIERNRSVAGDDRTDTSSKVTRELPPSNVSSTSPMQFTNFHKAQLVLFLISSLCKCSVNCRILQINYSGAYDSITRRGRSMLFITRL